MSTNSFDPMFEGLFSLTPLPGEVSKKLARFGEGAPRSDCPTVPCTTPETVYDHATPRHPYNLHLHLALYYATPAPCR